NRLLHDGKIDWPMSESGLSRRFKREVGMTASPQWTDISSGDRLVRVVPGTDIPLLFKAQPKRKTGAHSSPALPCRLDLQLSLLTWAVLDHLLDLLLHCIKVEGGRGLHRRIVHRRQC